MAKKKRTTKIRAVVYMSQHWRVVSEDGDKVTLTRKGLEVTVNKSEVMGL